MGRAYDHLATHFDLIRRLEGAGSLLFWDRAVVMRPGSAPAHARIAAGLAQVITEKETDPRIAGWLSESDEERPALDHWKRANLDEMRRRHRHATAVPLALQVRKAEAAAALNPVWQRARADNDFAAFAPGLREMIKLQQECAAYKAEALGLSPYDALMDEHDPGVTCAMVDGVFGPLSRELPRLLEQALARQSAWKPLPLAAVHAADAQRELCELLMKQVGYDFDCGRLDTTAPPFAMPRVPGDTRITTRYKEDDLRFALMATLHETGHSMYEYNLPRVWGWQPVGLARGATLHESQSLMLEMVACRSPEFVAFVAPLLAARFGAQDPAYRYDNLLLHYHRVQRNFIRIEADQIVYPLHVILRYDIERALLDNRLDVADLPQAWNEKMRELIGVVPPSDALGCLQDVHWAFGMFGYFPNYAMGAATAAQLFEAATRADPGILPSIAKGDFKPYYAWVKPNVHAKASSEPLARIIEQATGAPLSADALLRHLRQRYLG
ncbi:MAG TPA: carboxypeptidase M32 [Nevskiaceae bacterium]|nr:carboxypeptidase M32 [Nevskiaceae bacterium]